MNKANFLSLLLGSLLIASSLNAAVLTVTSVADSGIGTLRDVLSTSSNGDSIIFHQAIIGQSIVLTGGELVIDKDLTIIGNDSIKTTIDANNSSRIIYVPDSAQSFSITLKNLRLINGQADFGGALYLNDNYLFVESSEFTNNMADSSGGALYMNSASLLEINRTTFSMNQAMSSMSYFGGGAIYNSGGRISIGDSSRFLLNQANTGGGILSFYADSIKVDSSFFTANVANGAGGAIYIYSDSMDFFRLVNSRLDSNSARVGGAVSASLGRAEVANCIYRDNYADNSGGALSCGGHISLKNVLFERNERGGGMTWFPGIGGGAIYLSLGHLEISKGSFLNNLSNSNGGAISSFEDKSILIDSSIFKGNQANAGGAIYVLQSPASLDSLYISNSTLDSNIANGTGGAIGTLINSGQTVTKSIKVRIVNSKIRFNSSANSAGAIFNDQDNMRLEGVQIDSNIALSNGGGLVNNGGTLEILNSSLTNNSSLASPTTSYVVGGGAIYNNEGKVLLSNSTVSNNYATNHGGGILNRGYTKFELSTIAENTADSTGGGIMQGRAVDSIEINSSILAKNNAHTGIELFQTAGVINSLGYNLVGIDDATLVSSNVGDQIGSIAVPLDPLLDSLKEYQNQTKVHKLKCGSPAIDAANSTLTNTDQFGRAVFNNGRDIGAFEMQNNCGSVYLVEENKDVGSKTKIYPNPQSSDFLNIVVPNDFSTNIQFEIFDIASKQLVTHKQLVAGSNRIELNELKPAIYLVKIKGDNKVETHKLIYH